jgi:hypothetical protein
MLDPFVGCGYLLEEVMKSGTNYWWSPLAKFLAPRRPLFGEARTLTALIRKN